MNDMTSSRSLADVPTCDLNQELVRRVGVETIFLGPRDLITKEVRVPAWLIVNRD